MLHPKQHITDLAEILKRRSIEHIVISPGSRSAPLIRAFSERFGDNCISLVDERSAAYFALGIALYTQKPVVLICTSGTAVLNYAPALAEAFYQKVPLIAITADRPHEWIDQFDNQTLRQNGIYRNYIRRSFELPQYTVTEDDLWFAHRIANDAVNASSGNPKGPVQINVPLTEPLYEDLPLPSEHLRIIPEFAGETMLSLPQEFLDMWKNARRIMIVHGQDQPGAIEALKPLLEDPRVALIAENISNLGSEKVIQNSNLALSVFKRNSPAPPDLVLHSGGQVVSKSLTSYLRKARDIRCWRIGKDDSIVDTFRKISGVIPYPAVPVYAALNKYIQKKTGSDYRSDWLKLSETADNLASAKLEELPFSDIHVFRKLVDLVPDNAVVVAGNSSIIRYSQLFRFRKKLTFYSNRGVSGIDGSFSTAAGIARVSDKPVVAMIGDLGFLYDSNAMWNREMPANLKVIVINNEGGGIFHILKGPSDQPGFKKFVEANHPVNIAKLADAYGLGYFAASDPGEIEEKWPELMNAKSSAILEIKTNAVTSADSFRKLMAGN
ncbi:MAG TPA: 2-succinyl-5-enolpyruvyl-6-hydroxy-3-cyclohexene-1-carboxylic-acid synthase [Bacteroidales bacterium]|nr:2-succinyl-5-enolpyruvyl-6-hydroxy-3-cyclohexene-1-carboxylic-acid synthase [Bacteroidales bacterium]